MKKIILLITFVFSQPGFTQGLDLSWRVRSIGALFSNIKITSPNSSLFVTIEANGVFHKIGKKMEENAFNYGILDKVTVKVLKSSCDLTNVESLEVTCDSSKARATISWSRNINLSSSYKGPIQSVSFKSGEKFADFNFTLEDSKNFTPFESDHRYFISR